MKIDAIETPAILIDEAIARRNIEAFQSYCDKQGLKSRPHIKTHKLPHFAKMQIEAGAKGITCQKIGEAEVMADAGIDDILITYNIFGASKLDRLRALAGRVGTLAVVADNLQTIEGLAGAFADAPNALGVLIECDTGAGRCGVQSPEDAVPLAQAVANGPGLRFGGLMTYPPVGGAASVDSFFERAGALLGERGIDVAEFSGGGSPDMWQAAEAKTVTEHRAGTYIYNDRSLVERGTCTWDDCALTVLATVVSTPTPTRAVIDAGSKALTSDLLGLDGFGHIVGHPDARIVSLSEEHGVIHHEASFTVGERLSIIPNHVCVVSNLFDFGWLRTSGAEAAKIEIPARGKVT